MRYTPAELEQERHGTAWRERYHFLVATRTLLDQKLVPAVIPKELILSPQVQRELPPRQEGQQHCQQRCQAADAALQELFEHLSPPPGTVLAAVGSYGRRTLAPGSDLDIRILVPRFGMGQELAEALLYPLWNAKIQVGHQIVSAEEILELGTTDLPTATTLLDWRFLAGDRESSDLLLQKARIYLFSPTGINRLISWIFAEVQARHERFGGSVYLLEPDVKSGEGGLRDLDSIGWLLQAQSTAPLWEALISEGFATPAELALLQRAQELLACVRSLLHTAAKRRQDRLTFEHQEAIARSLGYEEHARTMLGLHAANEVKYQAVTVEAFMSDYYRQAQFIARLLERILRRWHPLPLGHSNFVPDPSPWFHLQGEVMEFPYNKNLLEEPAMALRIYRDAARLGLSVGAASREEIERRVLEPEFCDKLRASSESAGLFLELCTSGIETPQLGRTVVSELREVGLLVAMIPEFAPVVGRVHHDIYHVYTVDVHSVAALDRLKALVRGEWIDSLPLACRLAAEEEQPEVLFLATLLHDIGKALGGQDHASRGAKIGFDIGRRLGLTQEQRERLSRLIERHLIMYHTATKRDLEDSTSIEEFLRNIQDREELQSLYLLTIVDISTTSPTALTAWKAKLLEELFWAADARLRGEVTPRQDEQILQQVQEKTIVLCSDKDFARSFLTGMPPHYLLGTPPGRMVEHIAMAQQAMESGVSYDLRTSSNEGLAELCVIAEDRPGLLAAISAAIVASHWEIHGAQILSHRLADGRTQALDRFWVRCAPSPSFSRLQMLLDKHMEIFVRQRKPIEAALRSRWGSPWGTRPTPAISTEIILDDRSSPAASIVEVVARDHPGVLCALAQAFHQLGLSVSLARINTEGARAIDVFYITNEQGEKVELIPRELEIRQQIMTSLATVYTPTAPS